VDSSKVVPSAAVPRISTGTRITTRAPCRGFLN
jgi:hypothetical protein